LRSFAGGEPHSTSVVVSLHDPRRLACFHFGGRQAPWKNHEGTTTASNETGTDEAALIRKIVGGQRNLFGDLIAPHLTPLLRIVRATIGGGPEVEDIVQQTALKAFTHLSQFRFEAGFRT
jgi:hypothetical protein